MKKEKHWFCKNHYFDSISWFNLKFFTYFFLFPKNETKNVDNNCDHHHRWICFFCFSSLLLLLVCVTLCVCVCYVIVCLCFSLTKMDRYHSDTITTKFLSIIILFHPSFTIIIIIIIVLNRFHVFFQSSESKKKNFENH